MSDKHRNTSYWRMPIAVSILCIGAIAGAGIASAGALGGLGGGLGGALGGGGLGSNGGSIGGNVGVGGSTVGGSAKVGGNTSVGTSGNFNLGGVTSSIDQVTTNLTSNLPDLDLPGTLSNISNPTAKPVLKNRVRCNGMMSGGRLSWNHPQICG